MVWPSHLKDIGQIGSFPQGSGDRKKKTQKIIWIHTIYNGIIPGWYRYIHWKVHGTVTMYWFTMVYMGHLLTLPFWGCAKYFDYKAHSLNPTISRVQWVLLDLFLSWGFSCNWLHHEGWAVHPNLKRFQFWETQNFETPDLAITNFFTLEVEKEPCICAVMTDHCIREVEVISITRVYPPWN